MTARKSSWFDVDKEGLAHQLARRPKGFALLELLQNAIDENSRTVNIVLLDDPARGCSMLVVDDDNPTGFSDLADAYTLFKRSAKAKDPTKRGRFNSGEKMVLALCQSAKITSTTGSVIFNEDGTRILNKIDTTKVGSNFTAVVTMNAAERCEAETLLRTCLIPEGVTVTFNGTLVESRSPVRTFEATLASEIEFRPTRRNTTVSIYDPVGGEKPQLYEMGIPVVSHDGRWHVNIGQKVPLNADRDNVTPSFLREVRVAVLDNCHDLLTSVDAKAVWVKDALPKATVEAVRTVVREKFGANAVIFDPTNQEASKKAVEEGRTLVYGRAFTVPEWDAVRRAEALKPAGQVIQTGIPTSPDGEPPIPADQWTPAMVRLADYTEQVGRHLIGHPQVDVDFVNVFGGFAGKSAAWFGAGAFAMAPHLTFNLGRLGRQWPDNATALDVDQLLIHEFAHAKVTDHLSTAFHDECCRLGALLRTCPVSWGK